MSGGGIEAVLADHGEQQAVCECALGVHIATIGCDCGEWDDSTCTYDAHLAAAVLAWLDARLTEVDRNDLIYAVCPDLSHTIWDGHAACEVAADAVLTAALSAVRGVLGGEGSC